MSEKNNRKPNNRKRKPRKRNKLKIFLISLVVVAIIAVGAVTGVVIAIAKDAPEIDPTNISSLLSQTSFILDQNGEMLEKIQTEEYRTIVELDRIPEYLRAAFIAIEDERFDSHIGVDPIGIASSAMDNLKAGHTVRGASTITQQLARNLYLSNDRSWDRKIKEAYLALQIDKALTKDQVMEGYLNRIYLGQGAYGVQEAAQTYFSKDVDELTLAESALLAGVVKSPTKFAPYQTLKPEDFDDEQHEEVGQLDILGEKYIAIYNSNAVERQQLVLSKMLDLGKITREEYDTALEQDIKESIEVGQKRVKGLSSYFNDYIKVQVMDALVDKLGYTKEHAEAELYTGGLKIYSTMDLKLQRKLEDIYDNFTQVLLGSPDRFRGPAFVNWRLNGAQNIVDDKNKVIFYKQENMFDEDFNLIMEKGTFELTDDELILRNQKLHPSSNRVDIADYYTIDDRKNLVTHEVGSLTLPDKQFSVDEDKSVRISKKYLEKNSDFYTVNDAGHLLIDEKYFYRQEDGVVQPQSATVIMDYKTGQLKALVGGRDVKGDKILNRATASARQPGSAIKPLAVYLPALDNGYTAATVIDDIPFQQGSWAPRNWYSGYKGLHTLRQSVEQSVNVNSAKTLNDIGIPVSMEYLSRMGIIDKNNPEKDNFITSAEDGKNNDENPAALSLGGMTNGLSPLEMTAAFGSIANLGTYTEPIAFTKILDKDGNLLLDNEPEENTVVSPQTAFIMSDILRTTVTSGIAGRAQVPNMPTAGKTGTTQRLADAWFVGYTPYYVAGVWIGNDAPQIKLNQGSAMAAQLWRIIMTQMHEGLGAKNFDRPPNIVSASICTQSGQLAGELCSQDPRGSTIRSELFVSGTQPSSTCDVHVELEIDEETMMIANEYCPEENVKTMVFIQRDPPYDPSKYGGVVPADYEYTAPTEICDIHNEETAREDEEEEEEDEKNNKNNGNNDIDRPPEPGGDDDDENGNGDDNNGNDGNNGNGDENNGNSNQNDE
ncbi:MAG: PBP1A family penicillin-binding protein [Tissierellia bacterium]|nr:PBP1A family penicillin-binding protein [Tissierellia bacterium]